MGAAAVQVLRRHFGTAQVSYDFDSLASASSHHYGTTDALLDDITTARIAGGMHFRSAIVDGALLGGQVAAWAAERQFQPR